MSVYVHRSRIQKNEQAGKGDRFFSGRVFCSMPLVRRRFCESENDLARTRNQYRDSPPYVKESALM